MGMPLPEKDSTGQYPPYAWPGGYEIVYYDADCASLCAPCASKADWSDADIIGADIYYEGPTLYCENCNGEIESAYGDPEQEDQEEQKELWRDYWRENP